MFKKSLLALACAGIFTTSAFAGGLSEPVMEPEIIIETMEPASSSSSALLPMMLFTLLVAVAS